jgi:hypothetical protein
VDSEELSVEEEMPPIVQEMAALRMQQAFKKRKEERAKEAEQAKAAEMIDANELSALEKALPGAVSDENEEPEEEKPEEVGTGAGHVNLNQGDMPAAG